MTDLISSIVGPASCETTVLVGLLALGALVLVRDRRIRGALKKEVADHLRTLEERESLYGTLVSRASDGIVLLQDERIVMINPRLLVLIGCTESEVKGQPFLQFVHPESRAEMRGIYARRMAGGDAPYLYETALLRRDGQRLEVEVSGTVITFEGTLSNLVMVRDISQRRQTERKLAVSTRRLGAVNRRLGAAMIRAEELAHWAEEAERSKSEFLANMSCELRTPLTSIVGMVDLLRDEAFGPVNASQRESLESIDESSRHLLELINDILDMAKLESGRVELKCAEIDVRGLCEACMRFVAISAARKGVNTILECTQGPAKMWADARRLRQVLINLLGNAVKFTPSGGSIALVVAQAEGVAGVRFTVSDTGFGISRAKLAAIFEPMEKGGSALSGYRGGAGLGLPMARRLAVLQGGALTAQSEPGMGSSFTVIIPDRPIPSPAISVGDDGGGLAQSVSLAGLRILIAEDDATNARILELRLQISGASVTVVGNGREAVECARSMRPDVVLMDVQMPEMNGIDATRALKGDPLTAGIPIICLTVLAMDEDRDRCLAAGADDYLIKPVAMRALISKLRREPAGSENTEVLGNLRE